MNINPVHQFRVFAELAQHVQTRLSANFIEWAFAGPEETRGAPALRQGRWLPIHAERDAANNEKPLGEGGQGIVHLWCCLDDNNRITDRVIVKNIYPGTEAWSMQSMWRDKQIGGEPREAYICNKIYDELEAGNPGDGRFVTRCLGHGDLQDPFDYTGFGRNLRFETHPIPKGVALPPLAGKPITRQISSYKLYFEYCPHGDLHDQINAQVEERVARTITSSNVPFHEGFVWRMFEALAKCAVAMERANVLHGDLCPTNVFLGEHDPSRFAIWPTPKLSDFGSSREIDVMVRNRFAPNESLQASFAPPELSLIGPGEYEVDMQITCKTNIWQIGMLITCMMRLEIYLPECEWRDGPSPVHPDDELHFFDPDRRELRRGRFQHDNCDYSLNLLELARQCMRFDPNRRPSPRSLLRRIQARIPGSCGGMDTYTGNANGTIPSNKKERLRGVKKDEDWPLGSDADIVIVF